MNTGPIKGSGDFSFFFHTTLWAFLPWTLLLIAAVYNLFKKQVSNKLSYIITGSALISFTMFSLSRFQLPHYIVILLPHFALITGQYVTELKNNKSILFWNLAQSALLILLLIAITSLAIYSGFGYSTVALAPVLLMVASGIFILKKNLSANILLKGAIFSTALFYYLNFFFHPAILKYQSGVMAGKVIDKMELHHPPFLYLNNSWSFQFYCKKQPVQINNDSLKNYKIKSLTAFARAQDLAYLDSIGYKYRVIEQFDDFHVSILTSGFLNKNTRDKSLNKAMLIKIFTTNE